MTDPSMTRRVLVVDDDKDTAEMLCMYLNAIGHEAKVAVPKTFLEIASHFIPDACILDLCMPEKDGFQLVESIRSDMAFDNTVAVACTGRGEQEMVENAAVIGFDYYMLKPFDLEDVSRIVCLPRPRETMVILNEALRERCRRLQSRSDMLSIHSQNARAAAAAAQKSCRLLKKHLTPKT